MTTNQAGSKYSEMSDLSVIGCLIHADGNCDDGVVYETWDELASRGWTDEQIRAAMVKYSN